MEDAWSPEQYEKFRKERLKPGEDLIDLIGNEREFDEAVDLGCGVGGLTAQVHERFKVTSMTGLDSSESMIERARKEESESRIHWQLGSVGSFLETDGQFDLIFSNACLHWVDNHTTLFPRLCKKLKRNGVLAVQMPDNFTHPAYLAANEIALEEPFLSSLNGYQRSPPVLKPEQYAVILHDSDMENLHVQLRVYSQLLPSSEAVVEWTKGALLTPVRRQLSNDLFAQFEQRYKERVKSKIGTTSNYLFTFRRIFLIARRR